MRLTLLGTGDAVGTPKIGCSCPRCIYAREKGVSRTRTSLLLETGGHHLMIDTSPDTRCQLLRAESPVIDGVIWTHGHYDHYAGYGEFYRVQPPPPVYAVPAVLSYCSQFFTFLSFDKHPVQPYVPFDLFGSTFTFLAVNHPSVPTYGLRIESEGKVIGYTADTRADIPMESRTLLEDLDLLFIDAIVPPEIHLNKHMNYEEACSLAHSLGARSFYCVHLSHLIDWDLPCLGRDMDHWDW
ncbi:MAG: MBL fold metallo-hydrolase [Methanomicrobiales archaeon]|nr:MBL fold metallo-hydrolase [Methanomicrobiales archaeon]